MFKHTSREKGMWRGWLEDGHVVEAHWGRSPIGLALGATDNDGDQFRCQFWIGIGIAQLFLPLWRVKQLDCHSFDAPAWGVTIRREDIQLHKGERSKFLDWPWTPVTVSYEKEHASGLWIDVFREVPGYQETHPYTYTLRSGEVQHRAATVEKRRHRLTYTLTRRLGRPIWVKESIDVRFDGEVGERTVTWKGGTIGCGWDLRPGETMEAALRRMEAERRFT